MSVSNPLNAGDTELFEICTHEEIVSTVIGATSGISEAEGEHMDEEDM